MKHSNLLNLKMIAALTAVLFTVSSCKNDDDTGGDPPPPAADYSNSVLVTNEGPFQNGTGTITHINRANGAVTAELFKATNGRSLGNIVQSATRINDKLYVVVNNAGKVEVVNNKSFKSEAVIEGLELPRYIIAANGGTKAYVSQYVSFTGNGQVAVLDLATNTITKKIEVGEQPEHMILDGAFLFVINGGGNTVSKIDITTDAVVETITVGDRPNGIVKAADGTIWVLCGGTPEWAGTPSAGSLVSFTATNTTTSSIDFLSPDNHPSQLVKDGSDNLYYKYKNVVCKHVKGGASLDTNNPVINRGFYSMAFDNVNNKLYGSDAGDFTSNGYVFRYNHPGMELQDSIKVGIIPGNFVF